ncbi:MULTISPECIES: hypothetical protein [Ferrimonas]|uniref:hypothetical protein n=1 Tax=Ferrimonas TaxID=44011 RepID=UPI00040ECC82|nr:MULTISPECIES: hypothetical protein [Ferrimonas]USD36369.1 hypothetical protein J8Z22_15270 [Ferrimonas sp. SCSIO 43195]
MKKLLLGTLTIVVLAGCGQPEASWVHDTKDNQGFMTDRDRCNGAIDDSQADFKGRFAACMERAGWRLEAH